MAVLTTVVVLLAVGLAVLALTGSGTGTRWHGVRLGRVSSTGRRGARWARRQDVRALRVRRGDVAAGRLVLGAMPGVVRPVVVAAEAAQSLVVVGPTQSGKTTCLAVPAILGWRGPVVAASVKSDLLRDTLGACRRRGRVWCVDPTGATGVPSSEWSPLAGCREWRRAGAVALDLCEAAKTSADGAMADGDFWYATAAKLLAPLFYAAALDGRPMTDVVRWVDTQEVAEVADILERSVGAEAALDAARASWCRDERTRSSVYTTAETVLAPFAHPPVAGGGDPFTPERLLGGPHTLYVCAPAHDQRRLRGYFTALVQDVVTAAFSMSTRSGRPLDPPLLVVLDEAAHIAPLPELDGLAATCASHGVQLVTVWQDLAQVRSRYGARAATVVNNHRAKVFLPGIADPDTLEHASRLVGDEEITQPSVTRDRLGGHSTTASRGLRRMLPPESLRCLPRGRAVLVYGALPPARIMLRPWWAGLTGRRRTAVGRPASSD